MISIGLTEVIEPFVIPLNGSAEIPRLAKFAYW